VWKSSAAFMQAVDDGKGSARFYDGAPTSQSAIGEEAAAFDPGP
jgi:hypothetical protein